MNEKSCNKCKKLLPIANFIWSNKGIGQERKRQKIVIAITEGNDSIISKEATSLCEKCRSKKNDYQKDTQKECKDFYQKLCNETPCTSCGVVDGLCINFCREDESIKYLSDHKYWGADKKNNNRGIEGMKKDLHKYKAKCSYCFSVDKQQPPETAFDTWLNDKIVHQGTECAKYGCQRVVTLDNIAGFQFAHFDPLNKSLNIGGLRIKVQNAEMTNEEAQMIATKEWPKGRILCANCHKHCDNASIITQL